MGSVERHGTGPARNAQPFPLECPGDTQEQLVDQRRELRWSQRSDNDCRSGPACRLCWRLEEKLPLYPCSGLSRRMLEEFRLGSCQATIKATPTNTASPPMAREATFPIEPSTKSPSPMPAA